MVLRVAYQTVAMHAEAALDACSSTFRNMDEYAHVFSRDHERYSSGLLIRLIYGLIQNSIIMGGGRKLIGWLVELHEKPTRELQ